MTPVGDRALVVSEFESAIWPGSIQKLEDAWLALYQCLVWYEGDYLHVIEANELRRNRQWQARAILAEEYIAGALGVLPHEVKSHVDRLMRLTRWQGMQRNNILGNGFRTISAEILVRWGNPNLDFRQEEPATRWFPGIRMPGRSKEPRMDIFIVDDGSPRAIFSCKYGIRHDRISDPTNECTQYRAAAMQLQIADFEYYVITSEFSATRVEKVLDQPCVHGVIHTHLPLLRSLNDPHHTLWSRPNMFDMADFVRHTHSW